jgi:predicted amidohydrolase
MAKYLNVALVQVTSTSAHPDLDARKRENWDKLAGLFDQICMMSPTVDLLLAPELYVDGLDPFNWNALAEPIPGPLTDLMCAKAKQLGKWLAPGSMLEKPEERETPYNCALLISPDGEIVLKYRKTYVPYPLEPDRPGTEFPVFEIPGMAKVGFMICSDGHAPEVARNLVFGGAEVILKPTLQALWIGGVANLTPFTQVRAAENQCYVVNVNHAGPLGMGHSSVADPEGRIVEEMGEGEAWTMVSLDLDEVRRCREVGSFGCFPFLRMVRDFQAMGVPFDACYRRGIADAPLWDDLPQPMWMSPDQVERFKE